MPDVWGPCWGWAWPAWAGWAGVETSGTVSMEQRGANDKPLCHCPLGSPLSLGCLSSPTSGRGEGGQVANKYKNAELPSPATHSTSCFPFHCSASTTPVVTGQPVPLRRSASQLSCRSGENNKLSRLAAENNNTAHRTHRLSCIPVPPPHGHGSPTQPSPPHPAPENHHPTPSTQQQKAAAMCNYIQVRKPITTTALPATAIPRVLDHPSSPPRRYTT